MDSDKQLDAIRARIDSIDTQLLALISERAKCAQEVAEVKLAASQSADIPPVFYALSARRRCCAPFRSGIRGHSRRIMSPRFSEIMSSCLALEQPLSVAYLGPEGTYSRQRHSNISVSRRCLWASKHPQCVSSG
ncbi:MAG: hypothetical protein CM15mP74_02600 [Halieaceae bacterium]|nr:MAG: hypothetical protein CM15mP74_02600 [Halieaceae bacterium]